MACAEDVLRTAMPSATERGESDVRSIGEGKSCEQKVDQRELYFLLVHFLKAGPCKGAAELLEKETLRHGLLPLQPALPPHSPSSNTQPFSYRQLAERHPLLPPTHLSDLLQQLLAMRGTVSGVYQGVGSLLGTGALSLTTPFISQRPGWSLNPVLTTMRRETGTTHSVRCQSSERQQAVRAPVHLSSPALVCSRIKHQRTFRGHRSAVYCITFDRAGRLVITGSDDFLVKMWSAESGFLLCTCRGHSGDITDLSVNSDNSLVASSSNDNRVCIWRLGAPPAATQDGEPALGTLAAVCAGHHLPVGYCAFNPLLPHVLLSVSDDGTARLWDARRASVGAVVCRPTPGGPRTARSGAAAPSTATTTTTTAPAAPAVAAPAAAMIDPATTAPAAAMMDPAAAAAMKLNCCGWSSDGFYFAVGRTDSMFTVYRVVEVTLGSGGTKAPPPTAFGESTCKFTTQLVATEQCEVPGHSNEVKYLQWSHADLKLLTTSMDGTIRLWGPGASNSARKKASTARRRWRALAVLGLQPPQAPQASSASRPAWRIRMAPRPSPPPPAVHQAEWSLNDDKIVAVYEDNAFRIWNSANGKLLHVLNDHKATVFVLQCHPTDARLAMTADYDGRIHFWDIERGVLQQAYSKPGPHFNPEHGAVQTSQLEDDMSTIVDGRFAPDGTSFVISDKGGQFSIYSGGGDLRFKHAQPDQFYSTDYNRLTWDERGMPRDAVTGRAPQESNFTDVLCDYLGVAYPEPYQSSFQAGHVGMRGIEIHATPTPAVHDLMAHLGSEVAAPQVADPLPQPQPSVNDVNPLADIPREAVPATRVQRSSDNAVVEETDDEDDWASQEEEEDDDDEELGESEGNALEDSADESEEEGRTRRTSQRRNPHNQRASQRVRAGRSELRRNQRTEPRTRLQRGNRRADSEHNTREADSSGASSEEESPLVSKRQRASERVRAGSMRSKRRLQEGLFEDTPSPRRQPRKRKVCIVDTDDESDPENEDDDDDMECDTPDVKNLSSSLRATRRAKQSALLEADYERPESFGDAPSSSGVRLDDSTKCAGRSNVGESAGPSKLFKVKRIKMTKPNSEHHKPGPSSRSAARAKRLEHAEHAYAWLHVCSRDSIRKGYVPQLGDTVVYVPEGHAYFLEDLNDSRQSRPWMKISGMRAVEYCFVTKLDYFIDDNGSGLTNTRLTLKIADEASQSCGLEFELLWPHQKLLEDGFSEFIVEASLFESTWARRWRAGEACEVLWDSAGEGLKWAQGKYIKTLESGPGHLSSQFPGSPWNLVVVGYPDAPSENHSFWELADTGQSDANMCRFIQTSFLDPEDELRLLKAVQSAMADLEFEAFVEPPGIEVCNGEYIAVVALPMALSILESRLRNQFYRSYSAYVHDLETMMSNCTRFNREESVICKNARTLHQKLLSALPALPSLCMIPRKIPTPRPLVDMCTL